MFKTHGFSIQGNGDGSPDPPPTPPEYQFSVVLGSNLPSTLQVLYFNLTAFSEVHSEVYAKNIAAMSSLRIGDNVVAIASTDDTTLQAEQFIAGAFAPFGNVFVLPVAGGSMAMNLLTAVDIMAYRSSQSFDMNAIVFNGTDFHIEGDATIVIGDTAAIAFMQLGTVAVWCNDVLQTHVFIDPNWATEGSLPMAAGVNGKVALSGYADQSFENPKKITALNSGTGDLMRLSYDDGADTWSVDGAPLNIGIVANTCCVLMHARDFAIVMKDAANPVLQAYWFRPDLEQYEAFGTPFPLTIGNAQASLARIAFVP